MLGDETKKTMVDIDAIDPDECALVVIDELGDPTGTPLEPVLKPAIENTARLAAAARTHGVPVVFANDAHLPGLDHELDLWGEHGIAGTPGPPSWWATRRRGLPTWRRVTRPPS